MLALKKQGNIDTRQWYKTLISFTAILICMTFINTSHAADKDYCERYADNAIKQYSEAQKAGIPDLNPPVWQNNRAVHFGWCLTVSKEQADKGYRMRQDILAKRITIAPVKGETVMEVQRGAVNIPNKSVQTRFPDMQITKQWIEQTDVKCGPVHDVLPPGNYGKYNYSPMNTSSSYLFHVEIQNKGDGLLPAGQSFFVSTTCVRGNTRYLLGGGYTAANSQPESTFATYIIFPSRAGEGECVIETEIDTRDNIKEAIEGNNTSRMDVSYRVYK